MRLSRRRILQTGAGMALITATPVTSFAAPDDVARVQAELFGSAPIREGRVMLSLPPISENGYSVPISIDVDSPMTEDDHVKRIALFAPRNPLPHVASFHLGPLAGKASVSTRIRLGGTQPVQAVAEMSDGSLWSGSAETMVTLAACVIL